MPIVGIVGLPSAGKTYEMTRQAMMSLEDGIHVYPNYSMGVDNMMGVS